MAPQVWLITGCSSGFGSEIAKAALARGDKVVATARSVAKLEGLKAAGATTIALDITAGDAQVQKAVDEAIAAYGQVDIVVNNAGYIVVGGTEEFTWAPFPLLTLLSPQPAKTSPTPYLATKR